MGTIRVRYLLRSTTCSGDTEYSCIGNLQLRHSTCWTTDRNIDFFVQFFFPFLYFWSQIRQKNLYFIQRVCRLGSEWIIFFSRVRKIPNSDRGFFFFFFFNNRNRAEWLTLKSSEGEGRIMMAVLERKEKKEKKKEKKISICNSCCCCCCCQRVVSGAAQAGCMA